MTRAKIGAAAVFLLSVAASPLAQGPGDERGFSPLFNGTSLAGWKLALRNGGGDLEYDCAAGRIEGPLLTDRTGRFTANGYHSPGQGGPERQGYEPPRLAAVYTGRVQGEVMTLTVSVPSTGGQIGPLTLRHNAQPMIMRCL